MNNKGFTLVELLASIIILAVIMTVAIPAINNLSSQIRKRHLENTIKNIEIAASKYAFDTKENLVFVDKLVKEGYLSTEKDDDGIYNEVNNQKLNCYLVKMEKSGDHYNATFQNDKSYEVNGKCDESKLNELNGEVSIKIYNNSVEVTDYNKWLKGNVTLKAVSNNLSINCTKNKCIWTSSSGNYANGIEVNIDNVTTILNTRYNFQLSVNDGGYINRYNSSINLKIDNEKPTIDLNETKAQIANNNLKIIASDGSGSGVNSYYFGLSNGRNCNTVEYTKDNNFTITSINSQYLICVKDNVGNIAEEILSI